MGIETQNWPRRRIGTLAALLAGTQRAWCLGMPSARSDPRPEMIRMSPACASPAMGDRFQALLDARDRVRCTDRTQPYP
jgi:hypothetical protein